MIPHPQADQPCPHIQLGQVGQQVIGQHLSQSSMKPQDAYHNAETKLVDAQNIVA